MLVKEGVITDKQLDAALKAQVVTGSKLGTNLIELGFVDEEALAYFLSEKLNVPYAHPKKLLDLKKKFIDLIPRELIEKYKILPYELKRKRLKLVMADPQDLDAINEISFITGFIVEPMITPEVRLLEALELHYNIPRQKRPVQSATPPRLEKESKAPPPPDELSEEIIKEKVEMLKGKRESSIVASPDKQDQTNVDDEESMALFDELENASDRDAVADALIKHVLKDSAGAALFIVKGGLAEGWKGEGPELGTGPIRRVMIPLSVPGVFKDAYDKKFAPRDNPGKNPMDKMLRRLLKIDDKMDICVTSIYFEKVVICFLVAIAPRRSFEKDARDKFLKAAQKTGEAFARLIAERQKKEKST